jgi:hypothetical protein
LSVICARSPRTLPAMTTTTAAAATDRIAILFLPYHLPSFTPLLLLLLLVVIAASV